jgi:hypothetical protein
VVPLAEVQFFSIQAKQNKLGYVAGLPDGLFWNQKSQFGSIAELLARENLGKIMDNLVNFTAIANILWPFGIFSGHLVYFSPFWYLVPRKIWQPWYAVGLGRSTSRGCQIILGTTFQNGENRPKEYT